MENAFRAGLGQVVLVEWPDADLAAVTGLVLTVGHGALHVDLTSDIRPDLDGTEVVLSVFASEAMYRAHATLWLKEDRVAELRNLVADEPIQRRRWPRCRVSLAVSMVPVDGATCVCGETVDLSMGGTRVVTHEPLPLGQDPLLAITMPEGDIVLIPSRVIRAEHESDGFSYGLVFPEVDGDEAARIAGLVAKTCA